MPSKLLLKINTDFKFLAIFFHPFLSSDITEVSERMRRSCGLRQNTVDSDYSSKRLTPHVTEQRRASMTMAPR